jgi:probable F420-dependent oxidoreductase
MPEFGALTNEDGAMQFGFGLPTRGPIADFDGVHELAVRGEALGYTYLTVPDHLIIPRAYAHHYPYSDSGRMPGDEGGDCLDQLTVLTYAAAVTRKPRLLTSVMVGPHRPAVLTAKMIATIDILSKGRVTIGCGTGWMKEEFEALGAPPHAARGAVTNEYLRAFKELWTSDTPEFQGEHVSFHDVTFEPKPVQKPHPPIWIGGESAPANGWYPIGTNPRNRMDTRPSYLANVERIRAMAEDAGRDPATIDLALWANWPGLGATEPGHDGTRRLFAGSADQIAEDIEWFRELGGSALIFNFLSPTLAEAIDKMERYAKDVLSLVRS